MSGHGASAQTRRPTRAAERRALADGPLGWRNWKAYQLGTRGVAFDGFHPDRSDLAGALICLVGVG